MTELNAHSGSPSSILNLRHSVAPEGQAVAGSQSINAEIIFPSSKRATEVISLAGAE